MNLLPEPLHPAVVHFPVVLLLAGTIAAVIAVFWRGGHLPRFAALLLGLGTLGTWAAVETGESDAGLLEKGTPPLEALVDAHETWAKRTLALGSVAVIVATISITVGRWPRTARGAAIVTAMVAVAAAYGVYETGHRGGALVFRHAAGVQLAVNQAQDLRSVSPPGAPRAKEAMSKREED